MASKRKAVKNAEPQSAQKSARKSSGSDLQQVQSSELDAIPQTDGNSTVTRQRSSIRTSQSKPETPVATSTGTKRKNNQNAATGTEGAAAGEMVVSTNGKKGRQTSFESISVDTHSSAADVWAQKAAAVPRRSSRSPTFQDDVSARGILTRDVPSNSAIEAGFAMASGLSPFTPRTTKEHRRTQYLMELQDAAAIGNDVRLTKIFFDELLALQELGEEVALVDHTDKKENYTPLIWAAKNKKANRANTCRLLVELGGASINKQAGWNNNTALMKAAEKGKISAIFSLTNSSLNLRLIHSLITQAMRMWLQCCSSWVQIRI